MQRYSQFARGSLIIFLLTGLLIGLVGPRVLEVGAAPQVQQLSPCATTPIIANWTFTGAVAPAIPPSTTGTGTLQAGTGLTNLSYPSGEIASEDPAISFESWDTPTLDNTAYLEFLVDTTGRNSIGINFKHRRSNTGPTILELHYSSDGTTFLPFGSPTTLSGDANWHTLNFDLSAVPAIDDNPNTVFRLYGYGTTNAGGTWRLDNIAIYCIPSVTVEQSVSQADPAGAVPVNFSVIFSQPINVSTFTASDITQSGTATGVTWSIVDSGDQMNFTLSATSLTGNGTIIPSIAASQVTDADGYGNSASTSTDNVVTYNDTTGPTVTINQAGGQTDPTSALPINFAVAFSEPINAASFTTSDITQGGTATGITWNITNSGNNQNFTLSAATVTGSGTLIPSIGANQVTDLVGNNNVTSTSTDNSITYAPTATPTYTATTGPSSALDVLINEVAWMGTSAFRDADEWIELYNTRPTSINLDGWRITIADNTSVAEVDAPDLIVFGAGDTIPAGGYFILAHSTSGSCNIFTDVTEDECFTLRINNSPGQILRLYDAFDNLIDIANSDGGTWPAGSSATYSSMERRGKTFDSFSAWATFAGTPFAHNRDGVFVRGTPKRANWIVSLTPTAVRTPTKKPTPRPPTPSGRPVINEFLPRPGFDWNQDGRIDVFDEFIEVKNIGPVPININGWRLDDGGTNSFTLPSMVLDPGDRVVFYGLETNILLSDGGDQVRLLSSSGVIMDSYTYGIVKEVDQSWCRLPEGRDWYDDCVPTPGLLNTRDGQVPSMPPTNGLQPEICQLPDTLPSDFLFAECNGYGANMWSMMYWDENGWMGDQLVPSNVSKWQSFIQ